MRVRTTAAACVAAALVAVGGTVPATAGAVGPRAAERIAVDTLDSPAATIVFRAPKLVRAGGAVHVARLRGGGRPDATGATTGRMPVALRAPRHERAWLFYEDRAPSTLFEHGGRVVLVGERSGAARVSAVIQGPPAVGGRLPRFLNSFAGYRSPYYRRAAAGAATALAETTRSPLAAAATTQRAASQLAADRACLVRTADTLGNFHDYAAVDRSRAAVGRFVRDLRRLAPGIVGRRYRRVAGTTISDYVRRLIDTQGCREVSLYLAGGAYRAGSDTTIAIGVQTHPGGRIQRQLVSAADLRALLRSRPAVWWNLTFDAPHSGALLDALRAEPNLASAQTSGRASDPAYVAGRSGTRNGGMLEFTRGLLGGLRATLVDERAVAAAIADRDAKRAPTVLAALLTRSFAQGASPRAFADLGVRPQSFTRVGVDGQGGPVGPSVPIDGGADIDPTPVALSRSLTTDEDTALEIPLARNAAQAASAGFSIVAEPEHGTLSGSGSTRTYTPDADYDGADSLTFTVTEGGLTSAPATISIAVTPVNDAPELTTSVVQMDYPENAPATAIDAGLTIGDIDSTELTGATVSISGGYTEGDDVLEFSDQNGIAGSWNAGTGVLALSGSASIADYESALRSVGYRNESDAPPGGVREIALRVDDGDDLSAVRTVDVDVAGENDAPDSQLSSGTASYTEDAAATVVDAGLTVIDPDSANLASATVAITAGFQSAEDRLELTAPVSGITADYDQPTGVLTLTGPASRADFQQALRNVGYANVSDDPDTTTRTVSVTLTDSDSASGPTRSRDVTVAAVNDAPVVTTGAAALAYAENDPAAAIDSTLTVTDVDSTQIAGATVTVASGYVAGADTLAFADSGDISGAWNATDGVLTLTGSASVADYQAALRTVTYANASDDPAAGPRSIAFRVDDGEDESAAATQTVEVAGDNDAPDLALPAAGPLAYTENDDASVIDSGAELTDPDSASFASATATITAGLQPDEDRLELTAPVSGIAASYDQPTGVLTLTGPASRADFQQALRNVGYANASDDPDTTTRTIALQAEDSAGATTPTRTRDVEVGAVNDLPLLTGTASALAYAENDPATALDDGLTVADLDSALLAGATVQLTGGYVEGQDELAFPGAIGIADDWDTTTGTLTLTGPASAADYQAALRAVTYANTSDDPAAGARTATIQVDDGSGDSNVVTRTVEVTPSNDAPDVDPSGGAAAYVENAAATPVDGGISVYDADSASIASAVVKIATGFVADEDVLEPIAPVDGIAADYDDATGELTLTGPASRADFQQALRNVGYRNTSERPDTTTREISFSLTDSDGATGAPRTRSLTVSATNDDPVATDDAVGSTDELTVLTSSAPGVLANDDDVDGDPLTVVAVQGQGANVGTPAATAKGASVTVAADGSFSYDPSGSATLRALGEGETDTDTFTYAAGDGSANSTATVTVTVIGLPDPPEATDDSYGGVGNTTLTVGQTGPSGESFKQLSGSVLDNDSDPDTDHADLSIAAETKATTNGGSVTIDADGNFTYTPPAGSTSTDSFDYTVSDGERTDTGTVQVPLTGRVWYVHNQEAAGGLGRSADPFDTLAEAVSASSTGDTLYVFKGSGTTTGMNSGAVLKTNQRLLGESVGLVMGSDTLYTGVPANRPAIGNSAGTGVTLAGGSRVEGLDVSASGTAISGNGIAGSTIAGVNASGASGVSLQTMTGTTTFGDISITTSNGTGFFASGVAGLSVPAGVTANVTATGGPAVDVRSSSSPTVQFDTTSSTNSSTTGFNVDAVTGGTVSGASGTIAGANNAAVDVNAGTGTVSYGGNITDGAGRPADITSRTGGAVTISGTIAEDDTGISVTGNSGGTTTFSGTAKTISTGTGDAVNLANNTGHAISFTNGGLALTTTSGKGLVATGGGTVDVQGSANTIASTTGTALQVQSTTIGANDLTFRSIAANGGANGIVLDTTGASGGLTVTGDGTTDSGGVIQSTVGADGTNAGVGAYLNSTRDVSLTRMRFTTNQGHAIRGSAVNGFTLANSTVNGTNGTNDANDEGSIALTNLSGSSAITDTAISGGYEDNLDILSSSGTASLALTRIDVGANSASLGGNGVLVQATGTAVLDVDVTDSDFTSSREDLVQMQVLGTADGDYTFTGNRLSNNHSAKLTGSSGILMQAGGTTNSDLTYRIADNTIRDINGPSIFVQKAVGISAARGRIHNNTIGVAGATFSGGYGIGVEARGQGSHTTAVTNNTLRRYVQDGIGFIAGEDGGSDNGTVSFDATATGNNLSEPEPRVGSSGGVGAGVRAEVADPASIVTFCLDLNNNQLAGAANIGTDVRVFNDWPTNVFRLPGYAGGAQDATAVMNYFAGRNTLTTRFATVPGSGNGYSNTAACAQPPA